MHMCKIIFFSDEMAIIHLIKSYCQPLLVYACGCFHLLRREIAVTPGLELLILATL